jgi:hypothetical protein
MSVNWNYDWRKTKIRVGSTTINGKPYDVYRHSMDGVTPQGEEFVMWDDLPCAIDVVRNMTRHT